MSEVYGLKEKQNLTHSMVEDMNTSIMRMLKNQNMENEALEREV